MSANRKSFIFSTMLKMFQKYVLPEWARTSAKYFDESSKNGHHTFDVMDPVNLERAPESEQLALVRGVVGATVVGHALLDDRSVSLEDLDESVDADFGGQRVQFALQVWRSRRAL